MAYFINNRVSFTFFFPLISIFCIAVFGLNPNQTYSAGLYFSAFSFVISRFLIEVCGHQGFSHDMLSISILPSFVISQRIGVDGLSVFFIILTNLFIFLCILSVNSKTPNLSELLIHLFFLQWSVVGSFLFLDLIGFFIFFERSLMPIYFLVIRWGSGARRVRASYRMARYTLAASIFRFFNILYIYQKTGTTDYELLRQVEFSVDDQVYRWITFFIAFAAKIPLFPLHIWLPEAHVEAPTVGSVLLAALMLKIGTYGLIRFSLNFFPLGTAYFVPFVSTFGLVGMIYTCYAAIRQTDVKKIVAYSSVGHRNVVLLGIRSRTGDGLTGAVFQRISHGIVSGGLFFCIGVLYVRYGVRSLKYYGGIAFFYPVFAQIFLIFSLANIGFPLTAGFVGEFLIFMGIFTTSLQSLILASFSRVLGAVYTLWRFNRIFFGLPKARSRKYNVDLVWKERLLFSILISIIFWRGIRPDFFIRPILPAILEMV